MGWGFLGMPQSGGTDSSGETSALLTASVEYDTKIRQMLMQGLGYFWDG